MRLLFLPSLVAVALLAICAAPPLAAQQQAPARPTNLFGDTGGFEKSTVQDNLWDGVNSDNTLAGFTFSAEVVTEKAALGKLAMPPSVAFVDLNGDGRPDLVTADPTGFFRFYPNSGTPTAPKFTSAEIIPFFVSPSQRPRKFDYETNEGERLHALLPAFRAGGLAAHGAARLRHRQLLRRGFLPAQHRQRASTAVPLARRH